MKKTDSLNILLVDDLKSFRASLADGLTACDGSFCILTAENGDQALQLLASNTVDLVVTDLKMPLMDGFELLEHMQEKYPRIPAIVMSSFLDGWTAARLMALRVSRIIEKESLDFKALRDLIMEVIRCRGVCRDTTSSVRKTDTSVRLEGDKESSLTESLP